MFNHIKVLDMLPVFARAKRTQVTAQIFYSFQIGLDNRQFKINKMKKKNY